MQSRQCGPCVSGRDGCSELNQGIAVTCPDPMILARGLSVIVAGVLQKNADAAFRTSLVKNTLMVDTSPTLATVMQYQQHLKAEMETLAGVMGMGSSRGAEPKAKPMQVEDGATDRDKDKDRDKGKGKERERKGQRKRSLWKGKGWRAEDLSVVRQKS